jgi:hypothetical protein
MENSLTIAEWRVLVYGEGHRGPKPLAAAQALQENPEFAFEDPHAAGLESSIVDARPASSGMPPLAAVTHSSLSRLRPAAFLACARKLIALGADVNEGLALYGAAGKNHQPELTRLLLEAGANPNDNESVYHATETHDLSCLKLLIGAGASMKGTNSINHSLDRDDLACTQLLLDAGADPNEGHPALLWAIRRRRSLAHIEALLRAGADPNKRHGFGPSAYRMALYLGLPDIAARLREVADEAPSELDQFIAACARGDREEARRLKQPVPSYLHSLLPDAVAAGNTQGAKLMVEMGWPIAAKGGDWNATALNLAVFCGNAELARFLIQHGASWREMHGFGDDVSGTLHYAGVERPIPGGDWLACAKVLVEEGGMPVPSPELYRLAPALQAYFAALQSRGGS